MYKRRYVVVICWLLFISINIIQLSSVNLVTDLSLFLPNANNAHQQFVVNQLRSGQTAKQLLIGLHGENPDILANSSHQLVNELSQFSEFAMVANNSSTIIDSSVNFEQLEQTVLFQYRYLLDDIFQKQGFNATTINAQLQAALLTLGSPLAPVYKTIITSDPGLIWEKKLWEMMPDQDLVEWQGAWFSQDKTTALLLIETRAQGFAIEQQKIVIDKINTAVSKLPNANQLELIISGPAIFAVQSESQIKSDVTRLSIIAAIAVVGFLFLILRNVVIISLSILPLLTGIITAIVVVNGLFGSIHGITLGFGITLLGVAVDYPLHFILHRQASKPTCNKIIWRTLFLSVATTCVGYVAMLLSDFNGLAQLGSFTIVGLIIALLSTRWVLPVLIPAAWFWQSPMFKSIAFKSKYGISFVASMSIIVVIYLFINDKPLWEDNLANIQPLNSEQLVTDKWLRDQFNLPSYRHMILILGETEQFVLEQAELIQPMLKSMEEKNQVLGVRFLTDLLPSQKVQLERQKLIPAKKQLEKILVQALVDLPFKDDYFQPFIQDLESSKQLPLLNISKLKGTMLDSYAHQLFQLENQKWQLQIPMQLKGNVSIVENIINATELAGVYFIDIKKISENMLREYRHAALDLFLYGAVFIVILLLFTYRSFSHVLRVMLPVLTATLTTVALLVILGIKLSLFHLIALLLVVGLGLDYALFFNRKKQREESSRRTFFVLLICCITTIMVFSLLSFSAIPVLQAIGLTVAIGALLSFTFTALCQA